MTASSESSWIALVGAATIVLLMAPMVVRAWQRMGREDREISFRKIHVTEVPRAGGLIVMLAFGTMLLIGLAGTTELSASHELFSITPLTGLLLGALVVGCTGLYDDLVGLRAPTKLALQFAAAAIAIVYGLHWPALEVLLGTSGIPWAALLTLLYLVLVTNAINFMDGLDGLALGIVIMDLGVVVAGAMFLGVVRLPVGWVAACTFGAACGCLYYNRHPARLFLGDAGSYFLGFLVAGLLLMVEPVRWRVPVIRLSIPLLILAVPLFDTAMAIVRRRIRGQSVFRADADHVHHRLLVTGLSHARVVLVLWWTNAMFVALGVLQIVGVGGWWTLLGTVIAMLFGGWLLGYHRLLARLPAFRDSRSTGWRDRRKLVMALVGRIERLERSVDAAGLQRWQVLAPEIGAVLAELGVPAFEIREGSTILVHHERAGEGLPTWAWLSLPLRDASRIDCELRLALAVRLPNLQQEQLMLLERIVSLLSGQRSERRT